MAVIQSTSSENISKRWAWRHSDSTSFWGGPYLNSIDIAVTFKFFSKVIIWIFPVRCFSYLAEDSLHCFSLSQKAGSACKQVGHRSSSSILRTGQPDGEVLPLGSSTARQTSWKPTCSPPCCPTHRLSFRLGETRADGALLAPGGHYWSWCPEALVPELSKPQLPHSISKLGVSCRTCQGKSAKLNLVTNHIPQVFL